MRRSARDRAVSCASPARTLPRRGPLRLHRRRVLGLDRDDLDHEVLAAAAIGPSSRPRSAAKTARPTRAGRSSRVASRRRPPEWPGRQGQGATWRTVIKRYSGGLRRDATRDDLPARVGSAAFAAERGRLIGPIRSGGEHYVFKVIGIEPEHPTPLKTQQAAAWEIPRQRGAGERARRRRAGTRSQVAPAHDLRPGSRRPPRLRQHLASRRSRNRLTQSPGPKTRTSAELPRAPLPGV